VSATLHPSPEAPRPSVGRAALNVVKMFFVFAALGPPFGWLTLFVPLMGYGLWTDSSGFPLEHQVSKAFSILGPGIVLSYFLGLPTALVAGLFVIIGQLLFRSFGILHAVGAALTVGLVLTWYPSLLFWIPDMFGAMSRGPYPFPGSFVERLSDTAFTTFNDFILKWAASSAFCLVPTLACWAIGRPRHATATPVASC
jgi:hypothetical protein